MIMAVTVVRVTEII
uniref:Uncharacterized protein n=1 Tax=Anguilla anguilla TaxID=7936 RepID=A0A0E9VJE2_ANGAN